MHGCAVDGRVRGGKEGGADGERDSFGSVCDVLG